MDKNIYSLKKDFNGLYFKINAYYSQKWNNFTMRAHRHSDSEFMHVVKGNAFVEIYDNNAQITNTVSMKSGDTVFINSNVFHRLVISNGNCHIINMELGITQSAKNNTSLIDIFLPDSQSDFFTEQKKNFITVSDNQGRLTFYFIDLINELNSPLTAYHVTSNHNIMLTLVWREFLRQFYLQNSDKKDILNYVYNIRQYIQSNFSEEISMENLASHVGLNKSYMQKIYTECTGETIGRYISQTRLERAAVLLSSTDMPLVDIAVSVGYGSRQGFFAAFKKYYGINPQQYRKDKQQPFHYLCSLNQGDLISHLK